MNTFIYPIINKIAKIDKPNLYQQLAYFEATNPLPKQAFISGVVGNPPNTAKMGVTLDGKIVKIRD